MLDACYFNWKHLVKVCAISLYLIFLIAILWIMSIEFRHQNISPLTLTWIICGIFILMAIPISLWSILQHLINYTQPNLQKHIIRILWMVPIYAINSWFALRFEKAGIYLDTARECYEAYVILNFFKYLTNFLKINRPFLESDLASKHQIKHLPPICCVPAWRMGRQYINNCRHGVLQYTALRIITTLIAFICAMCGERYYGEGDFNFKSAWSYLIIVNNVSQIYAMYCLIMFYKATREELSDVHPVGKFLCVKFVVFLSFWQSLLITGLVNMNLIIVMNLTKAQTSNAIQNACICVEMFFAALAHYLSFPYAPFVDKSEFNYQDKSCFKSFKSMWDVSDVRRDLTDHITYVGNTATNMLRSEVNGGCNNQENLPLLDDSIDYNEQIPLSIVVADGTVERISFNDAEIHIGGELDQFINENISNNNNYALKFKGERKHNLHVVTIESFEDNIQKDGMPYFNVDLNNTKINKNDLDADRFSISTINTNYNYKKIINKSDINKLEQNSLIVNHENLSCEESNEHCKYEKNFKITDKNLSTYDKGIKLNHFS